jgi:hypothetical protein
MKKVLNSILFCSVFVLLSSGAAFGLNVALNADVDLHGTFFTGGWGGGLTVDEQTVVDDVFLPRSTQWDQGPVWWDSSDGAERFLTIDLGGVFSIESFVIQADDNDGYFLYYWDIQDDSWSLAWDVPNYTAWGWGMQTRPNPADDYERYLLSENIVTNALRFEGNMNSGDKLFAVSEIQAYGNPVPEPSTWALLGIGLVGLISARRKFKK